VQPTPTTASNRRPEGESAGPAEWEIVGDFYSYERSGWRCGRTSPTSRAVVNNGLMDAIESGQYFRALRKVVRSEGRVPYPLTPENKPFCSCRWCRSRPDPGAIRVPLGGALERQSGRWLLQGLDHHRRLSALGWCSPPALGIVSGAMRTAPVRPLRALGRSTLILPQRPLLVWMFFWYFGVPPLLPEVIREWLVPPRSGVLGRMFALACTTAPACRRSFRGHPGDPSPVRGRRGEGLTTFQAYRTRHRADRAPAQHTARDERIAEPARTRSAPVKRGGAHLPDRRSETTRRGRSKPSPRAPSSISSLRRDPAIMSPGRSIDSRIPGLIARGG